MKTEELAERLIAELKLQGKTLSTAESCTGGGIGHVLTAVSGSSAVYAGGVISYTNGVKEQLLLVSSEILEQHGAVSGQTAEAMAQGIRNLLHTEYGVSVTGLAGPDGDGSGKPVGLVYVGVAWEHGCNVHQFLFQGDRRSVRQQAVEAALNLLIEIVE